MTLLMTGDMLPHLVTCPEFDSVMTTLLFSFTTVYYGSHT